MKKITLKSPAKINLTLDIIKKTSSAYHEIRSIMMPINLHDTITIKLYPQKSKTKLPQIILKTAGLPCPKGSQNSSYIAAALFCEALQIRPVMKISIHKRIPQNSGLGGGSSNAGTTLRILQALFNSPLSQKKLQEVAQKIGMDTPFFLNPVLSLTTHYGEKCTPIAKKNQKLPRPHLIFTKIKKISTANTYSSLNISLCNKQKRSTSKLLKLLKTSPHIWEKFWNQLLHNDFSQLYPQKSTHQKSHLTGAGPTRYFF
jgi:4-diphosphocytidyl-2-C-methyl-D-erythritol kinase